MLRIILRTKSETIQKLLVEIYSHQGYIIKKGNIRQEKHGILYKGKDSGIPYEGLMADFAKYEK